MEWIDESLMIALGVALGYFAAMIRMDRRLFSVDLANQSLRAMRDALEKEVTHLRQQNHQLLERLANAIWPPVKPIEDAILTRRDPYDAVHEVDDPPTVAAADRLVMERRRKKPDAVTRARRTPDMEPVPIADAKDVQPPPRLAESE